MSNQGTNGLTLPPVDIYTVGGVPPEILATSMALFSRSPYSMREAMKKVTEDRAGKFLRDNYLGYGHGSIADMGLIAVSMENIPQLFCWEGWDNPLTRGQERSTRYQPFNREEASYLVPTEVQQAGPAAVALFERGLGVLFDEYSFFLAVTVEELCRRHSCPEGTAPEKYQRTMNARAFDVARYWLCWAVSTSFGQVMSIRTFEKQAQRLLASPYADIRRIATELVVAVTERDPYTPPGVEPIRGAVAPTLARHVEADSYLQTRRETQVQLARDLLFRLPVRRESAVGAELVPLQQVRPAVLWASLALYEGSHHILTDIVGEVEQWSDEQLRYVIKEIKRGMRPFDPLPGLFGADRQWVFDVLLDGGAARDLHRHGACVQIHQPLSVVRGYSVPDLVVETGLETRWRSGMEQVGEIVEELREQAGYGADYLIPFGYFRPSVYALDTAAMRYMTKLRSQDPGHFAYRQVAAQMAELTIKEEPLFEELTAHQPFRPDHEIDIFAR